VSRKRNRVPLGAPCSSFREALETYRGDPSLDGRAQQAQRALGVAERVGKLALPGVAAPAARRWAEIALLLHQRGVANTALVVRALKDVDATTVSRNFHGLAQRGFILDPTG
jgi:hypothetical protein